ncbi:DUF58 domain-containing protein [Microbacterium rhizomatis]|uniref:DUF58 domain-containing protein n=1 Tax=Microbacterium rhizomatis TaxID=1631477 RepID=A0A5J5J345_9MICO|nr:DUF58 domain-containing protein [Microbacterium rhizomatis]KAA9107850.1 DUF58 domain-containing protein [Microbacterium rhizomatis]
MTLTDSRVQRTSDMPGASDPHTRTRTEVAAGVRGRRVVCAVVAFATVWQAARAASMRAARGAAGTVRPAGVLVLLAATVGLGVGFALGWVEWLIAGMTGAALLAMSVPFLFGARAYEVELVLPRDRVSAGQHVAAEVIVRNRGRGIALPGRMDVPIGDAATPGGRLVEFGVPLLRPGHTITQDLHIPPLPRGIVTVGPATTVRSDPIGILRREHAFDDMRDLYVHPRTVALPSTSAGLIRDLDGSPTRRLVDADMSFHAIREYASGDSRRHIHWKSTAKTGRLMVRQYEESRRSRMAVILGLAVGEYADGDEFELAVSCAASLGLRAIGDARDLDIVVGAEIPRAVKGRLRAIRRVSAASRRTMLDGFSGVGRLENTMHVAEVCRLAVESPERLSVAFVVVGSIVPLPQLRHAALAFGSDTAVVAIVCDEGAHPGMRRIGDLTVVTVATLEDLSGLLLRGAAS